MALNVEILNKMTPIEVLENEEVKERFVKLYNHLQKRDDGDLFYEREKYNLIRIISNSKVLPKATGFSAYCVFIDIASVGFTLNDAAGDPEFYVMSRGVYDGNKWNQQMYLDKSPYVVRDKVIQSGQMLYIDDPVVVYEHDKRRIWTDEKGEKKVYYEPELPRTSNVIVFGYVRMVRNDHSIDISHMTLEDVDRLKGYSQTQNSRGKDDAETKDYSNPLYTSNDGQIDVGFFKAKLLKNALKAVPKKEIGQLSKTLASGEHIQPITVGLDDIPTVKIKEAPTPFEPEKGEPGHEAVQAKEEPEGVTIQLDDEDEF